jgi:hypothetical protein
MENIRCVGYKNEYSAEKSSFRDLEIGLEYGVVGCSSKVFGSKNTKRGDIVLITADKDKKRYAIIGRLEEKIEGNCIKWMEHGGMMWDYNWTYTPLTNIFQIDNEEIKQLSLRHDVKWKNVFHSRFSSKIVRPVVDELIEKYSV